MPAVKGTGDVHSVLSGAVSSPLLRQTTSAGLAASIAASLFLSFFTSEHLHINKTRKQINGTNQIEPKITASINVTVALPSIIKSVQYSPIV